MASRGELERRVLVELWGSDAPMSVAGVQRALACERELAYTTILTVLDRLAKKGLVRRQLVDRAWQYRPARTWAEAVAGEMLGALGAAPAPVQSGALRLFVAALSDAQRELLAGSGAAS